MNKRVGIGCILMLLFGLILLAKDQEVTIYCDKGDTPYSYAENDIARGLYVEIIEKALLKVNGYKVKIEPVEWKTAVNNLEKGEIFAIFPPYTRKKERPWMEYSVSIFEEELVLVADEKEVLKKRTKWPDDYADMIIGINLGFLTPSQEDRKKLKINQSATSTEQNLLKLGLGRIDGYINDKMSIFYTLNQLKQRGRYKKDALKLLVLKIISKEEGHVGYKTGINSKYPFKEDFKVKLDKALSDMKKNGEIDKIAAKYIQ